MLPRLPRLDGADTAEGPGHCVKAAADTADPPRPAALENSPPGVFAAGDVRHRSVKRVTSAVGVGAVAVAQVPEHLDRESGGAR